MFRGNYPASVEGTGRFKMPVAFKTIADEERISEFYVTSATGKSAEVWPLAEWEKLEQTLESDGTQEDLVQQFKEVTSHFGQQVKMDAMGRFVLPQILRESAKLDGDVAVYGMTTYLEIHNMEEITKSVQAKLMTKEERNKISALTKRKS